MKNNSQEALELSKKLLTVKSTANSISELKKVIFIAQGHLQSSDINIKRHEVNGKPSLAATMQKTKTPEIFLNGHLDVVPAKSSQFNPQVKGNRLYARGAQDMKAACAVLMTVFKDLAEEKSFPKNKLGIMLVTDEEVGGFNGSKALLKKGYKPKKFLITGESTNFDLEIAAKGVLWLKLIAKGKASHGAYLWEGKNAIAEISKAIEKIRKIYPVPKKEVWKTTCNVSAISGGNSTNRVPDKCELKLDIRYIPDDNPNKILSKIKKSIPKSVSVKTVMKEPFLKTDSKNKYLQSLKKTATKITGKKSTFIKKHGASDARFFSQAGIPTTSFGPVGKGLHSDKEWVSIKSLKTYYDILHEFLLTI